ncbi:2',3'-cyclic-nucleotide 2'-phosphodiesterase (5'-nucleotidase family) [Bacillus pakistanensis]|uniref:2',3'-cyclic-nucleotide 2'-phosphodiesterase (5'-nucleotidase family) n=1 Tax=Rossellomorea pakistanensis TaxID=992288 RepID=A0ABS2NGY6_9BACI|nr:bifunctional UDP-sugar hydrolase/5'-nucleotidase [Bacillus pakistanensis]MBM7587131.1 2',3'-cyclic-nucleotide 2'-phosphodiesterase (5'-nucleotidase family) [Bacillus pakistanensis]
MKQTITIIHTNDLHGNYDQLLRQAAFIKKRVSELEEQGKNYILLDGGDHLDMSINECLATNGGMHLEMLEDIGYHAMSVGNNELLRSTPELIRKLSLKSKVPWLLLNLVESDGASIGGVKETHIVEVGDHLKVGLFGATDQFGDLYENKHGFRNRNTLESINKAVTDLKEHGANLIVFLSHLGYDADLTLAKSLSGMVDVIVGAHTHHALERPVVESDVVIVQAGCYGNYVGELNLEYDLDEGIIEEYKGKLTEIKLDSECDPSMTAILERGREQTKEFLSEALSYTGQALSHTDLIKRMAEGMRDFWDADIGIMYGGAATDGMEKGSITKGKVLNLCRSMHSPVLIEMKGEQIVGLIKDRFKEEITSKKVYGNGFRPHGIEIGALEFSGITWIDQSGVITDIKVNGESLDENRVYTVGSGTPLLYAEVCGYKSVSGCKMIDIGKTVMVKDVFMDFLKKSSGASDKVNA